MSSSCANFFRWPADARSHAAINLMARRFALLAEPMRVRLVQALFDQEKSAGKLAEEMRGTPANISRHLMTLVQADILVRKKQGIQVRYALADPSMVGLCEMVCGGLNQQLRQQAGALAGSAPRAVHDEK